jgi:hypothetical protein
LNSEKLLKSEQPTIYLLSISAVQPLPLPLPQ